MKTPERCSPLLDSRWPRPARAVAVLLGLTISLAARTEPAVAQGQSSHPGAGVGRVRDSLAFEFLKARGASLSRSLPAMLYINARLEAMLPADPAQRSRIMTNAVATFDARYATDSAVFGPIAHTYAMRFSEPELRQLIAYERMRPEIDRAMSVATDDVVMAHRVQLEDIVRKTVGTVTGSTPPPMPAGPLVSVTATPPFLRTNPTQPASAPPAADPPPCADTGKAPAVAFRGPPYRDPVAGLPEVLHLGANLGAPTVQVLVPVHYPPALRSSGTQGTVTIHYWVNPSGCAEPASFQVKQASDSAMAAAVRNTVRRLHFVEPGPSGTMLWASVEQVFTFRITP